MRAELVAKPASESLREPVCPKPQTKPGCAQP